MTRYFLIIIVLFFATLIVFFSRRAPCPPSKIQISPQKTDEKLVLLVKEINDNIQKIESLCYKRVRIKLTRGVSFKTKATLYFKQSKNIRMLIENFIGKQMDIGSNEEIFWFWSKYMDPPAYYYSKHKDLDKTNLKTPLCPDWIIESMGFKQIPIENFDFIKNENFIGVSQSKISILGDQIKIITLIDQNNRVVTGRYLCDKDNNVIASVEYKNYTIIKNVKIPDNFVVSWHQENIFMEWYVSEIELNEKINNSIWQIPNCNKIDLSK